MRRQPLHHVNGRMPRPDVHQVASLRAGIEQSIMEELSIGADAAPPEPPAKRSYAPARTAPTRASEEGGPRPRARADAGGRSERRAESTSARREEQTRSAPPAPGKSAEDLKAILRTMTAKADTEKTQKSAAKAAPLKGALAQVVGKEPARSAGHQPTPRKQAQSQAGTPPAATPEREARPESASRAGNAPFEVPEETLRAIFKDR